MKNKAGFFVAHIARHGRQDMKNTTMKRGLYLDVLVSKLVMHRLFSYTPPKQAWNLKMDPWKKGFLLETIISRFHVEFRGCKLFFFLFLREDLQRV